MHMYVIKLTRWEWKPWFVRIQAGDWRVNWLRFGQWQLQFVYPSCGHDWQGYSYTETTRRCQCRKCGTWKVFQ